MTKPYFDGEHWRLSPEPLQQKTLKALAKSISANDLDPRSTSSLMECVRSSNYVIVRQSALEMILNMVGQRNSSVSFPGHWLNSIPAEERRTAQEFTHRLQRVSARSSIRKYPSYAFELEDIESHFISYMRREVDLRIGKRTKVATLGSCFAINVAMNLKKNGYDAEAFELGELVNNSYTNLAILSSDVDMNKNWAKLQPEMARGISRFKERLRESEVVILTLGLGLAFYNAQMEALTDPLYSFRKEHYKGYNMRAIPVEENLNNFEAILARIKEISPSCKIIASLSPIPLDGVKGDFHSAVEADCISKSIGRLTLYEAEARGLDFYYFPSYELVRWIASARPGSSAFAGDADDWYVRHPTTDVIKAVMRCFMSQFCG